MGAEKVKSVKLSDERLEFIEAQVSKGFSEWVREQIDREKRKRDLRTEDELRRELRELKQRRRDLMEPVEEVEKEIEAIEEQLATLEERRDELVDSVTDAWTAAVNDEGLYGLVPGYGDHPPEYKDGSGRDTIVERTRLTEDDVDDPCVFS